jgi:hypothetical protein
MRGSPVTASEEDRDLMIQAEIEGDQRCIAGNVGKR